MHFGSVRTEPGQRLFVALWPSTEVIEVLDAPARPDHPSVRWTGPGQWHVTLRFVGEVAVDEVPALVGALAAVGSSPRRWAAAGPATARLGRNVMVPVAGVDDLARAAVAASGAFCAGPQDRPFTGHVTLARGRGRSAGFSHLAGQPVEASWPVTEVALVRSHLGAASARYETIATIPLQDDSTVSRR